MCDSSCANGRVQGRNSPYPAHLTLSPPPCTFTPLPSAMREKEEKSGKWPKQFHVLSVSQSVKTQVAVFGDAEAYENSSHCMNCGLLTLNCGDHSLCLRRGSC